MTTIEFLTQMRQLRVRLWAEDGQLHCRAPRGVLTPAIRAELEARKADVIAFLQQSQSAVALSAPPIPVKFRDDGELLPLSYAQQRLWVLNQFETETTAYNLAVAVQLRGQLNLDALQLSVDRMVQRHEVLRTVFTVVVGEPFQQILPHVTVPIQVIDLTPFHPAEQTTKVQSLALQEAQFLFDLTTPPLLRIILLKLAVDQWVLLLTMHHIITDAWSIKVFVQEMASFYEAIVDGSDTALLDLPLQYADYAVWQRDWLQGDTYTALCDYWRQQMAGCPQSLDLPLDYARPAAQTFHGAWHSFSVPSNVTAGLKTLCHENGTTLFMAFLAAYTILLQRYTRQQDIPVGTPIAGRTQRILEGAIGFFVNTLVLRTDLSGDPTFHQLLECVRQITLDAYAHQTMPFGQLVEQLQPARDLSRNPLFQVMFAMQNAPLPPMQVHDLVWSLLEIDPGIAQFDLTLEMREEEMRVNGRFEYNTDLFTKTTISRMCTHFQTLLHAIVARPDCPISALSILTEEERRQCLVTWNQTRAKTPAHAGLHRLFEQQTAHTPEAVAVVDKDEQLTYAELDRRANQLARYLQNIGVGPEVIVGVFAERSLAMTIGLLGVLKAGGAFLPLDIHHPQNRIAYLLADAGVSVVLTQSSLKNSLPQHVTQVICLDTDWSRIAQEKPYVLNTVVTQHNLAYVIYTSGSTGTPKGCLVSHQAVVNHSVHIGKIFALRPTDRVLQFASIGFDVAIEELFPTWLRGGTVFLFPDGSLPTAFEFSQLITQAEITVLNLPASFWHEWVRTLDETGSPLPPSLRLLIVGSERVLTARWQQWQALARQSGRSLKSLNAYGATEATITSLLYESTVVGMASDDRASVPVGHPISNVRAYILDRHLQPVPIGVPGELYIGGEGLAHGYLRQTALTAERFVPDPFSKEAGGRLYRTGDLARYLPDGNIDLLGRIDTQVKVRGHRIEPGEIEAVLNQRAAVQKSVIVVQRTEAGNALLVAYVVPTTSIGDGDGHEHDLETAVLSAYLRNHLPDYMVPAVFVLLESLPLLANGKIDFAALPAWEKLSAHAFVAPRTPTEMTMAKIWQQVLGATPVGIHDNFFELGGDSILSMQIVSRANQAGLDVTIRDLFQKQTIAELSAGLVSPMAPIFEQRMDTKQAPLSITPVPPGTPLPLSLMQQRLWFLYQLEPERSTYHIFDTVYLDGALDVAALTQSLNQVIARHDILRTAFVMVDDTVRLVVAKTVSLPLPVIDLRDLESDEQATRVQQLAQEEAGRSFDLACGPLLRAQLLRLDTEKHLFLLTMHHIISDGWSTKIFIREMVAEYEAACQGVSPSLPNLPIQYADFAYWQQHWLQGDRLAEQIAYWRQQLDGELPRLTFPLSLVQGPKTVIQGDQQTIVLTVEQVQALQALSRKEKVTLFMILLTAFKLLLSRHTGQSDIVVGTPIANRNHIKTEGLIGFFVNTLVLRTNLAGNPRFQEALARVRDVTLGAYAHQDLPFEKLVEIMQPKRDLTRNPLFDVMVNFMDTPQTVLKAGDVIVTSRTIVEPMPNSLLNVYLMTRENELDVHIVYNPDIFPSNYIAELLSQYQHLLDQIIQRPDALLDSYSLVTAGQQLVLPDPTTILGTPQLGTVVSAFFSIATQFPEHPAIVQGGHTWCYDELAQRTRTLAQELLVQGVKPGDVVAVHGGQNLGTIASILAVFASGGVLLTIDDRLPEQRQQVMLQEARVTFVLDVSVTENDNNKIAISNSLQIIFVDALTGHIVINALKDAATPLPLPPLTEEAPAYIFFTSGTTDTPKGVLGGHKGLAHFLSWQRETFTIGPEDRAAQLTGLSFDVVLRDILTPLTSGAALYLPDTIDDMLPNHILHWLARCEITMLHAVPSLMRMWMATAVTDVSLPHLRWLFMAGEPLSDSLIQRWYTLFPDQGEFVNLYGPTETTLAKCYYRVSQCLLPGVQPLGRPLPQTQVLVLAEQQRLCGIGEPGEIVIRTPFRSLGYINAKEEQTARFFPNPFMDDANDVVYATGDLGCYGPDGTLQFLGRMDYQLKIRGVRVEPGSIEATLSHHPDVNACVVMARQDETGETLLVAYLVRTPGAETTVQSLRQFLHQRLPAAMIPSIFIWLDVLPLNANGKVNRRALPNPDAAMLQTATDYIAPRSPFERELADIWAETLQVTRIGISDDFFDLGGHSLLAVQLVSRVREAFHVEMPLRQVFDTPTIAEMADAILHHEATQVDDKILSQLLEDLEEMSSDDVAAILTDGTQIKIGG